MTPLRQLHRVLATLLALATLATAPLALGASGRGRDGDDSRTEETTDGTTTDETTTGATTGPVAPAVSPGPAPRITRRVCGSQSSVVLAAWATPARIDVDVQVVGRSRSRSRGSERWRVVVLHDRWVVRKAWVRSRPVTGWFQHRQSVANWEGADVITARAVSPLGETCLASVTVK